MADTPNPAVSSPSLEPPHPAPASFLPRTEVPPRMEPEYGWRPVREIGPDGRSRLRYIPLTRYDVLHPQEGDRILRNDPHQVTCIYLYSVCKAQLPPDATAVVFQDTGVYWEDPILDHHSPDVTIILGVKKQKDWRSFHVADEGVKPELVMEVTSPSTFSIDTVDKVQEYAEAGVPWYLIEEMDGKDGIHVIRQRLYQLREGRYQEQPADERGWHWLETVGLYAGIEEGQAQLYDPQGRRRGSYAEVAAELAAEAEARALAEARAAEAEERAAAAALARASAEERASAEQRARTAAEERLVAEERARTTAEERVAAEERTRMAAEERAAAEARARSEAEERARSAAIAQTELEQRMRELEAELRRLRGAQFDKG